MRLLISVRSVEEALTAARGGADFVDLKEPRQGALGGLPLATIRAIVDALRQAGHSQPVSATIGDVPVHELAEIQSRVSAVAACGVDIVKVGIDRDPAAAAALRWLAACGARVVPLFIADAGIDDDLVAQALALPFYGVMVDTADKSAGSLFDLVPQSGLLRFVQRARAASVLVGLAGALRQHQVPALRLLEPDFAGFRGAVCLGDDRTGALCATRIAALKTALLPSAPSVSAQPG